jgi:hypothetical protein
MQLMLQTQKPKRKRKTESQRIFELMGIEFIQGTCEWTLAELQLALRKDGHWYSETSISARLRELAHGKIPGWTISKRTENGRTWYYKLIRDV